MGASGRNEASCRVGALGDHVVANSAPQIHQTETKNPTGLRMDLKPPLALGWTQTLDFSQLFDLYVQSQRKGKVSKAGREVNVCSLPPLLLPKDHFHPPDFFPRYGIICFCGWERQLFWKLQRNISLHIYECFSPLPCLWMTRVLLFLLTACWDRYFPFKQGLLLAAGNRGSKPGILF